MKLEYTVEEQYDPKEKLTLAWGCFWGCCTNVNRGTEY